MGSACHLGIVSAKRTGNMHDASTIIGCDIVAGNHPESLVFHLHEVVVAILSLEHLFGMLVGIVLHEVYRPLIHFLTRSHPRHELLVVHFQQVSTLIVGYDTIGHELVAFLELGHFILVAHLSLGLEISSHAGFGHNHRYLLCRVRIVGAQGHIVYLGTHAECDVGGQRPRRGGPCHEAGLSPSTEQVLVLCQPGKVSHFEQGGHRCVLHVAVAAGLVQLVAGKSRTCCRRIGLDGVALIEQPLVVELLEQPPECLDILVVVSDIGMVKVDEISHLLGQLSPLGRELHHVLAAFAVVVFGGDVFVGSLVVDVFLGDAEFLLHSNLHGKSVCVPSGLAFHLKALHGLVAVEGVLDGTGQNMMDAGMSVG